VLFGDAALMNCSGAPLGLIRSRTADLRRDHDVVSLAGHLQQLDP
jgi:hypothetical protein